MSLLELIREIPNIPRKNREKRNKELKLHEYLEYFAYNRGGILIQDQPEIIPELLKKGYIQENPGNLYQENQFRRTSIYELTHKGNDKYKELSNTYRRDIMKKMLSKKPARTTQK